MEKFFRNPSTVSEASLVVTAILYMVIIASFIPSIVVTASTFIILIKIALTILIFVGIFGFIYTLFIKDKRKGKQKLLFLLLHFVSLCAVSFGIYAYVLFKSFAP
ncbi:hypothetical protein [Priestia megaterium]|uniref:hypothetical protein n=1 Tax=Priestia megaterium TaxID=1404 RepID=UPI001BEAE9D7|nr:hypothetical protein [Priestia megaterium]MBT2259382.1 hypothetical protein [Priestia megaterium]